MVNISKTISSAGYDFLKTDLHLNGKTICLCLSGSHAYGMETEGSDIDVRGVALNSKQEILLGGDFEQVKDNNTDTTIYSLKKFTRLLCENNPNIIEMLGVREDMYITPAHGFVWEELKSMEEDILSQRVFYTFGGYANDQLRRLENKSARDMYRKRREEFVLRSVESAGENLWQQFPETKDDAFRLYIDKTAEEIYADVSLSHYPLRDLVSFMNGYGAVIRDFDKLGRRNKNAIEHGKIAKHMAHLIRLYFMAFDILDGNGVITYREKEHDLLMDIRNGEYLREDGAPTKKFYDLAAECEDKLKEKKMTTRLREKPDKEKLYGWLANINEKIVTGEIG